VKTLRYLSAAICLSIIAFSSCKPKTDYSNEISRLDSALQNLKEAEIAFLSADTNSLRRAYDFSSQTLHQIGEKINKDTLQKNTALVLADAYEHVSHLQNMLENKPFFKRALTEGEERITNLKHDLAEDLHEKNKSMEYVVNEINASQKLSEAVNKTIEKAKTAVSQLDSMKTQLTFLSDSLMTQ
jgi:hypothetical protein